MFKSIGGIHTKLIMNKKKLFIENFMIYGLGGILSKIVPLVMLPVIINIMPSSEYFGISDLTNTLYSLCASLAGMGLYDAVFRLFFEKEDTKFRKEVCSTALNFCMISSIVVFILMIIFRRSLASAVLGNSKYVNLISIAAITTIFGATNALISAPIRMQNKRVTYIVMNLFTSVFSYLVTILMIYMKMYLYALPIGIMVSTISTEIIFWILNRKFFSFRILNKNYLWELLKIGLPLLPNSIIYWIFNSCDRLMITNIINAGASGIYAVGAKIGSASQLIYTAFSACWQYFAFYTMKEKDQVENNSRIYEYLAIISFVASILLFQCSSVIYKIFFPKEYYGGFVVAPYLFLAPLLQMLLQVSNSQLIIIKNTKPNMVIMFSGALINIILNYLLIPVIGIEGAAIATLIGYLVSNLISIIVLKRMKQMIISKRLYLCFFMIILYIVIWYLGARNNFGVNMIFSLIYICICICFYKEELKNILYSLKKAIFKK